MAVITDSFLVDLEYPPQVVYDYVSDLTRHGEWALKTLTVTGESGALGAVGARYRSHLERRGREVEGAIEVTEIEAPRIFAFRVVGEDAISEHRYTIEPLGHGTRLSRTIRTEIPGIRGFVMKRVPRIGLGRANRKSAHLLRGQLARG